MYQDLHGFTSGNITVKSVSIAACKMYMYSCLTEPIDQLSHRFTIFYTLVLFSTCNLYTKAIKALYLLIFVLWYFKNYYKFIYNFILVCFNSQVLVIIHFNLLVQKKWKLVFDELKEWWNKSIQYVFLKILKCISNSSAWKIRFYMYFLNL